MLGIAFEGPLFRRNPLDITFGRIDEAWRRCGLPGVDIHLHLAFEGRIEVERLAAAHAKLLRLYPILAALRRRDEWLGGARSARGGAIAIHHTAAGAFQEVVEALLQSRAAADAPPLQMHLVRCDGTGDRLIVRWPHALADARGGVTLLEEIARLDRESTPIDELISRGDESRDDFGTLDIHDRGAAAPHSAAPSGPARTKQEILHLASSRPGREERIGLEVRTLSADETRAALAAAVQTCGVARFADYLRATGIAVLDSLVPPPKSAHAAYSTLHLVDNRKRRDPSPVCHNVFSTIPVVVPARLAQDRSAVADLLLSAARAALERGAAAARLRRLRGLARLPHGLVAGVMAWMLVSGRRWLPTGLASAPSLPLGFMGPPVRPLADFCGARLLGIYGVRVPSLHAGYAVNLNLAEGRLTIALTFFEPRVSRDLAREFVDRFALRTVTAANS